MINTDINAQVIEQTIGHAEKPLTTPLESDLTVGGKCNQTVTETC